MQGGKGGLTLASKVIHATEQANTYAPLYDLELPIKEKIEIISPIKNRTIQYGKKLIASSQ